MQLSQEGDNVMTVTCTAEDGATTQTYTVHVYRMPKYEGIIPTMEIIDPNIPPEPPTYSVPMTVTLPLVGEMATTTALIIGAALLVVILLLVGFLLGRIGHGGDDYDDDDDTPPQPPRPPRADRDVPRQPQQPQHHNAKTAPPQRPVQKAAPQPPRPQPPVKAAPALQGGKVSDDTLTSPFVEDLSAKMRQEMAQRQAAAQEAQRQSAEPPAAPDSGKKVDEMSLDELLNDIHNM